MGFLSQMLSHSGPATPSVLDDFWYGAAGRKVSSGVDVNETTAMNYSAVWAAVRLISETVATLPRFLFERQRDGGKQRVPSHPTYRMFNSEPNPEQGGVNHFAQQTQFVLNWGNAYAEIDRDPLGRVIAMWPIHPSRIPNRNIHRNRKGSNIDIPGGDEGEIVYLVNNKGGTKTPILKRNMFHLPGVLSENGLTGKGVIAHAAESIGMGLATEQFGASFFGNGAAPSIVLTHPKLLGETASQNLRNGWKKQWNTPGNANGFLILEEGTDIERLTIPPEEAQFLQTRQFNISEIARWYNLPVHLLREMSKSSFSNIESESLHFVIISIMPWLVRWEDELNRQLLNDRDKISLFFKFMLQGLLRGDMKARAAFYKDLWYMGVYSINDILELEDKNPIGPDGNLRFVQSSMVTLEQIAAGPQKPKRNEPPPADPDNQNDNKDMGTMIAGLICKTAKLQECQSDQLITLHNRIARSLEVVEARSSEPNGYATTEQLQRTRLDLLNEIAGLGVTDNSELRQREKAFHSVARKLFVSEFSRIVRKEAKGAKWAAEQPSEFMSRLDGWFEKHRATYGGIELQSVFDVMRSLGMACDLDEFSREQLNMSYTELIEQSGTATASELSSTIDAVTTTWEETKVEQVADLFFG